MSASGKLALARKINELTALYRLTDKLYRIRTLADVYEVALDAITETLGCSRASILLFDEAGVMRFVAWRGLSHDYRNSLEGHSPWQRGDVDPEPIFVEDIEQTDEPDWIKATILRENIRALAFIPVVAQGGVIGKFMTYYEDAHEFGQHEAELAVTIARQVGFSVERERSETARREAEEALRHSEGRFRLMSENAPVMIWISDTQGRCQHLNSMLRAFWGVDEARIADFDWQETIHPDDAPNIGRHMMDALEARRSVSIKGRFRDARGDYRLLQTDAQPYFSAKGVFQGMIGVNLDITEREQAEHDLRESEERFRLAVEAAPSGMVMTDHKGCIFLINDQAEALFGYERNELIGQPIEKLVPERFRKQHPGHRETYGQRPTARSMGVGRELFALRKDGSEVPVEIGLSPIVTADGPMTLAAVVDISERRRADAQREMLLAELNHRVKNTLAVVQGIAHQTFRSTAQSREAQSAFEGRLMALAAAHSLLTQTNWESASLQELATEALQARGATAHRAQLYGPSIRLPPKQALAIAMALHELCTNAMKYGALSVESGRITLAWRCSDGVEPRLRIVWTEQGGPHVSLPKHRGFGSRLIERMLAQDLGGEVSLEFRPEGLICSIDAPAPRLEGHRG